MVIGLERLNIYLLYMKKYLTLALFLTALLLVIHHAYKHRSNGEDPLYGLDQYFQLSDVGNFRTFNHEMFVILLIIIGCVILIDV
jgi:hypothetical protein